MSCRNTRWYQIVAFVVFAYRASVNLDAVLDVRADTVTVVPGEDAGETPTADHGGNNRSSELGSFTVGDEIREGLEFHSTGGSDAKQEVTNPPNPQPSTASSSKASPGTSRNANEPMDDQTNQAAYESQAKSSADSSGPESQAGEKGNESAAVNGDEVVGSHAGTSSDEIVADASPWNPVVDVIVGSEPTATEERSEAEELPLPGLGTSSNPPATNDAVTSEIEGSQSLPKSADGQASEAGVSGESPHVATVIEPEQATTQESEADKQKLAMLEYHEVDRDFILMGEYQGHVEQPDLARPTGVQVVALGDGRFSARRYSGGLPGTGWNRTVPILLEGTRDGDILTLQSDADRIVVLPGVAVMYDADGRYTGSLQKVQRRSPTLGKLAPPNAYTLFDGTDTNQFVDGEMTSEGWLKEGTDFVHRFRDFTLHIEYRLPYMPYARGQGRSNSGVYLQSSYEVQILDSFGLEGIENECGALYRYQRPDVNMCLPPLSWQTYDLTFRSPRFDSIGNKIQNARITVLHNGVAVHSNFEIERKTGAGKEETPTLWPIKLQDHSNPVRFRNIWLIDLERSMSIPSTAHHFSNAPYEVVHELSGVISYGPPVIRTRIQDRVVFRNVVGPVSYELQN